MSKNDHDDTVARASKRDRLHYHARKFQRHPAYLLTKDAFRIIRHLVPNCWRIATYCQRCLPTIVIVGAQKAGTTQLYANLIRHPQFFGGVRKELNYFSKNSRRPRAWYQSRFPLRSQVARVKGICLEASPSYLPSPDALRRMHALLPNAMIVAVLRDPVARAFSHYQHDKTRRREPRSFTETVAAAIEENRGVAPEFGQAQTTDAHAFTNCVGRGYYALQLATLLQCYPREQVVVFDSADLFRNTNAVCQHIFGRFGIAPIEIRSERIYNRGYYQETINAITAERLREHYQPHDQLLAELLGRRFSWMTTSATAETCLVRSGDEGRSVA